MTAGRKLKFKTVQDLQDEIDWYFFQAAYDSCGNPRLVHKPITITGLAYYLGFESRQSITDYQERKKFSYTIKRAKLRIEQYLEECLYGNNVTGIIFNLKNNFKWVDQQSIDHSITDKTDHAERLAAARNRKKNEDS